MNARHGSLSLAVVLALSAQYASDASSPADSPVGINSKSIELSYGVNTEALPLEQVTLFVSEDDGAHWRPYLSETQPSETLRFHANRDGQFCFYVVVENALGASSAPPRDGQAPQRRILIDTVAPLVQVHQVRVVPRETAGEQLLIAHWTAFDAHLGDRPVALYYELEERPGWRLMAGSVPNVSRYDWVIPETVAGRLRVKVTATDTAGNSSSDVSAAVVVQGTAVQPVSAQQALAVEPDLPPQETAAEDSAVEVGEAERQQAQRLYDLGMWHKDRGDYGLAIERLIEAVNLDPSLAGPGHELAEIYYVEGNFSGALNVYDGILGRQPQDREALRGSALAMVALRKYPEALRQLETVLGVQPTDAQSWLDTGDVFLMMGQRAQSQHYWREAMKRTQRGSAIAAQAQQRISKYAAE